MHIQDQELYIGLMSGTSADGVDASIISTNGQDAFSVIGNKHLQYPTSLQKKIKSLNPSAGRSIDHNKSNVSHSDGSIIKHLLEIEKELTDYHITAVKNILNQYQLSPNQIRAIGFHGQTIYHAPESQITYQIGNAQRLAMQTNIDVVYDFRKADLELGGQGAPLIPIFHKCIALAYNIELPVCFVNIGGVSNISYIDKEDVISFDSGPGNGLIDELTERLFNQRYDNNGDIARSGKINHALVEKFMQDEYFSRGYPKSLDIYHFNSFIEDVLELDKHDAIASMTYFTAMVILYSLETLPSLPKQIFICGGGVHNSYLTELLKGLSKKINYNDRDSVGNGIVIENISSLKALDPDYIESQGFAYLAARKLLNLPSSFSNTTGVSKPCVCGVVVNI